MSRKLAVLAVVCLCVAVSPTSFKTRAGLPLGTEAAVSSAPYVPGEVIVKLSEGVALTREAGQAVQADSTSLNRTLTQIGARQSSPVFLAAPGRMTPGLMRVYRLKLDATVDVRAAVEALASDPQVEYAEPNYIAQAVEQAPRAHKLEDLGQALSPAAVPPPNDPLLAEQWGLWKINAASAWDVVTGTPALVIGVVDSGIDLTHPDLASQVWRNPGEIPGNGVDDDNDGYVDDVNGWNFVAESSDVSDDSGHGTQVAGVMAAATNNGQGIAGLCWNCRVMPVKVMQGGIANYSDIAAGVAYAADKGARVINLSLGGYADSHALRDAITAAVAQGAVVVGGAGNDNASAPFYPAAYGNVLAVAGTTDADGKAAFSNYGPWVDVSAPGVNIRTTFMGGDWGSASGTSLAAPFASGLAGLIRSRWPDWSEALVRNQIVRTAAGIDALNPTYAGELGTGRLNAALAMQSARPLLKLDGVRVNGDALGRPEPGQMVSLTVTLRNDWEDASGVTGVLHTGDANVTLGSHTASYGTMASGGTGMSSPAYSFTVASGAGYNHLIAFTLAVSANAGGYTATLPFTVTTATDIVSVQGTLTRTIWGNGKTYMVDGNLYLAPGYTLTIQPGTLVRFNGKYVLDVGGTLIAEGTEEQPIRFIAKPGRTWEGVVFEDTSADAQADSDGNYVAGNLLRYVEVSGNRNGIRSVAATPYLSHVSLDAGGIGGELGATPLWLQDSAIKGGVDVTGTVTATLARNSIQGNVSVAFNGDLTANTIEGGVSIAFNGTLTANKIEGGVNLGSGRVQGNQVTGDVRVGEGGWAVNNSINRGGLTVGSGGQVLSNTVLGGSGINISCPGEARDNIVQYSSVGIRATGELTVNTCSLLPSGYFTATHNRLTGNQIGLAVAGGWVQENLIANNAGGGLELEGEARVISNTLTGNGGNTLRVGSQVGAPSGQAVWIEGNNLEGNTGPYDVYADPSSGTVVTATLNWWGVTDLNSIGDRIFDYDDSPDRPRVLYQPLLNGPTPAAPAYVRGITLTPGSPVGIQSVAFDVLFSRSMDRGENPHLSTLVPPDLNWRTSTRLPTARAALGVAAASNGKLYAIGGSGGSYISGYETLDTVEEYDPATGTWTARADMPTARYALGVAAASNGRIYAIGGYGGTYYSRKALATVEEYDPATDTWRPRASMPTARDSRGVAAASNGKIYVCGGYDNKLGTSVYEYDPATDTWTTRASMPTLRWVSGVAAASNGKIYAIGGTDGLNPLAVVEEYDPATDTWTIRAGMPTARGGLGVVAASNGRVYAIGGWGSSSPLATVEEYDPATDTWGTRASMMTVRSGLGVAAANNGKLYALGGENGGVDGWLTTLSTVEETITPTEIRDFYGGQWLSDTQYRTHYDVSTLIPRGTYTLTAFGARGADGIEIVPYSGVTFTVDYAGAINDVTPPAAPSVWADLCRASTTSAAARWSASDADSAIDQYRYALGVTRGGTEVLNWTSTSTPSVTRTGLYLTAGQKYYFSVKARNRGGLWSAASTSGFTAGVPCSKMYLPLVLQSH